MDTAMCGKNLSRMSWSFGPHAAGYQIKDFTNTIRRPSFPCLLLLFFSFIFSFVWWSGKQEVGAPQYDPDWLGTGLGHV